MPGPGALGGVSGTVSKFVEKKKAGCPGRTAAGTGLLFLYSRELNDYAIGNLSPTRSLACLKAFFKEYRLSQISLVLIEKYKRHRKEAKKADATVNRELTFLRHFFNKCIDFRLADSNPFRVVTRMSTGDYRVEKVKLFKEHGRTRYLREVEPLLAAGGALLSLSTPVYIVVAQELHPDRASAMSGVMMGLAWSVSVLLMIPFGLLADWTDTATALRASSYLLPLAGLCLLPLPKLPPGLKR